MKTRSFLSLLLFGAICAAGAHAQSRYIVRVAGGLASADAVCGALNCQVASELDGTSGQVF